MKPIMTLLLHLVISIKYPVDTGHMVYCLEVFERQARVPGGRWLDAPTTWADVRGDPALSRDETECPTGWQWKDLWMVS